MYSYISRCNALPTTYILQSVSFKFAGLKSRLRRASDGQCFDGREIPLTASGRMPSRGTDSASSSADPGRRPDCPLRGRPPSLSSPEVRDDPRQQQAENGGGIRYAEWHPEVSVTRVYIPSSRACSSAHTCIFPTLCGHTLEAALIGMPHWTLALDSGPATFEVRPHQRAPLGPTGMLLGSCWLPLVTLLFAVT